MTYETCESDTMRVAARDAEWESIRMHRWSRCITDDLYYPLELLPQLTLLPESAITIRALEEQIAEFAHLLPLPTLDKP